MKGALTWRAGPVHVPARFQRLAVAALLCAGSVFPASAQTGSNFADPLDTPALSSRIAASAPLMAVTQTPSGRLVACGRRGVMLWSDDGEKWQQAQVPVSTDLVALSFPTPQHGWAVGHGGVILHTADGGATWVRQFDGRQLPGMLTAHYQTKADAGDEAALRGLADAARYKEDGPGQPFLAVWFEDERNGLAVGAYNLALRTSDGGRSWQVWNDRLDNPQGMHVYAALPVGDALWLAAEQGVLLKGPLLSAAGDAGTYARVPTPYAGTFFGVTGQGNDVVAFGLRGNAVRSRDGGLTWVSLNTGTQSTLTGGVLLPDNRMALVTMGGEALMLSPQSDQIQGTRIQPPMPLYGVTADRRGRLAFVGARGAKVQAVPGAAVDNTSR